MASKAEALARVEAYFDDGTFTADLARRVAIPTESQNPEREAELRTYLDGELRGSLEALGFACEVLANPKGAGPFLLAERIESNDRLTLLSYGHGDVVLGMEGKWQDGLSPWILTRVARRLYGRGTADNKGQHSINIAALASVIAERGSLGFNCKLLIETGEEVGSPGLREFCAQEKERLRADLFIASDGPRVSADRPTVFLGNRGALNFDLSVELREGAHHSGNWGGALANPGIILAHALASITTAQGKILVDGWLPNDLPKRIRQLVRDLEIAEGDDSPEIDPGWGEPGLTPAEKVYAWNTFEILSFVTGDPEKPVNAIPASARAHCQIRFVVGVDPEQFIPSLRRHLDRHGFQSVTIARAEKGYFPATRLDPDHPWVHWVVASVKATTHKDVAVLPSIGGSLPNDIFSSDLGLPAIWIPHSYPGCSQHAVDEHMLRPVAREGLQIMTALFWDLADAKVRDAKV